MSVFGLDAACGDDFESCGNRCPETRTLVCEAESEDRTRQLMNENLESFPLVDPDAAPGRVLRSSGDAPRGPGTVVVSRNAAQRLTSIHISDFDGTAHNTNLGAEAFSPDIPNVDPTTLGHLDDRGVVRVGTEVGPGMVLVGRIGPPLTPYEKSPEERKLETIVGSCKGARDISLRCPPDGRGVVTHAELFEAKGKKQPARVEIVVELERELVVGDLLCDDDGESVVVVEIVDDLEGWDISWPGMTGEIRVHKIQCAEDVLHARSIGPYSIVTLQPLGGKAQFGGQVVGEAEVNSLRERRAVHTIHEMFTAKSDDIEGRYRLYESIVLGKPSCQPTIPASARVLESELAALGFEVNFEAQEVSIGLLDSAKIRERMPGVVKKPETLNYRTFHPEPQGLFCEEIFGPLNSNERRWRLGRLELPVPLLHPWAFDIVASLLEISSKELKAVLYKSAKLDGSPADDHADTGGYALLQALDGLDLGSIAASRGERAKLASDILRSGMSATGLIFDVWPVLPPDLRPLVPLDGGRFATSDMNDLYRRLINRGNRLSRLMELDAPDIIIRNEHVQMQQALDSVVENGLRGPEITGPNKRPLYSLTDMISGERGRFSTTALTKRVDYSAQATAVPCSSLEPGRVRLPRDAARELFKPWCYDVLERDGHTTTIKDSKRLVNEGDPRAEAALDEVTQDYPVVVFPRKEIESSVLGLIVELWDELALGLHPSSIDALSIRAGDMVAVHVPADPNAVHEVQTKLGHDADVVDVDLAPRGWLSAAVGASRIGDHLMASALGFNVDAITDPIARTMLGRLEHSDS